MPFNWVMTPYLFHGLIAWPKHLPRCLDIYSIYCFMQINSGAINSITFQLSFTFHLSMWQSTMVLAPATATIWWQDMITTQSHPSMLLIKYFPFFSHALTCFTWTYHNFRNYISLILPFLFIRQLTSRPVPAVLSSLQEDISGMDGMNIPRNQ